MQPSSTSPILVIGATGKTGRRIGKRLAERGLAVREGSRRSDPPFDWERPEGWPKALSDVQAVYITFYPDLAVPGASAAIETLTACAREAGVKRLVLLAARGEVNAQRCEAIVRDSGLPFTLLRASWFSQNFSEGHLLEPVRSGVLALPAGDVLEPFVDADDIAEVAVAALTDERHAGRTYELTGPRLLSWADAAAEISKASGREVQYASISLDEYRSALAADAGPEFADMLTYLCRELLDGRNATLCDGVQQALGRAPRDFADFCRSAAASGVWKQ